MAAEFKNKKPKKPFCPVGMLQCAVVSQGGIGHLVSFTSGYSYADSINLVPDPKLCADFSTQMEELRVFAPCEGWIDVTGMETGVVMERDKAGISRLSRLFSALLWLGH